MRDGGVFTLIDTLRIWSESLETRTHRFYCERGVMSVSLFEHGERIFHSKNEDAQKIIVELLTRKDYI